MNRFILHSRSRSAAQQACRDTSSKVASPLEAVPNEIGDASVFELNMFAKEPAIRNLAEDLRKSRMSLVLDVASKAPHPDDREMVTTWLGEMGADDGFTEFFIGVTSDAKLTSIVRAGARSLAVMQDVAEISEKFEDGSPEYMSSYSFIERFALAYTRDLVGVEYCYGLAKNFIRKVSVAALRPGGISSGDSILMATYGWVAFAVVPVEDRERYQRMIHGIDDQLGDMIDMLFEAVGDGTTALESSIEKARFEQVLTGKWN